MKVFNYHYEGNLTDQLGKYIGKIKAMDEDTCNMDEVKMWISFLSQYMYVPI